MFAFFMCTKTNAFFYISGLNNRANDSFSF